MLVLLQSLQNRLDVTDRIDVHDDAGFNTAELLGNAALAIGALVVIWGALNQMGADVVDQMRSALGL